jgi:transcriptional regulator with XRE-family HTH domain
MSDNNSDILEHYGTPRHSGRYPWGSGDNPQRNKNFVTRANELKKQGLSQKEIAAAMNITNWKGQGDVATLRARIARASNNERKENMLKAWKLKEKGWSTSAIGREMGANESTIRGWLDPERKSRTEVLDVAEEALKNSVNKKKYIDVGPGTNIDLGITDQKLKTALIDLKDQGYHIYTPSQDQVGNPGKKTRYKILVGPGTTYQDTYQNMDKLSTIQDHVEENPITNKLTSYGIETPKSIDSNRVCVRYEEDGGKNRDGIIELRRNCPDLNLGSARYAQVRISVDGTHYLKGMAMYCDDLPKGKDVRFNTNKSKDVPMMGPKDNTVLKPLKSDPNNPFGASIVQHHYKDKDGKEQLSSLNIVGSKEEDEHKEGSWLNWSRAISSQFLSKQDPKVAKQQLDETVREKQDEYNEILKISNPVVRKKELEDFADGCDSDAAHLKAAGFPRQGAHVLLSFPDMKENEVYAPNYQNGEEVALVRFPHAGTFEIPTLKVNNKPSNPAYKDIYNAKDAIGVNPKVLPILSGADCDGDTVVVIPLKNQNIKTRRDLTLTKSLKDLQNFDPNKYELPASAPEMTDKTKQTQMGEASNLITDMTLGGADTDEIVRAVRHSMVVIDAQKHRLDYKQSYRDENIDELKRKYQNNGGKAHGASTLISRANADARVNERRDYFLSDKTIDENGKKLYRETGRSYKQRYDPIDKEWVNVKKKDVITPDMKIRTIKNTSKVAKMDLYDDAKDLMSGPNHEGTRIEKVYADFANKMKTLGNAARKEYVATENKKHDPSATKAYRPQVESLKSKLYKAMQAKPLERKAQIIANQTIKEAKEANPDMTSAELKKIKGQALTGARYAVNGGKPRYRITIDQDEWDAMQAGAFTNNMMRQIIDNADSDQVKKYATPRATVKLSDAKQSRAKSMYTNGFSLADIADALGVSTSTVSRIVEG